METIFKSTNFKPRVITTQNQIIPFFFLVQDLYNVNQTVIRKKKLFASHLMYHILEQIHKRNTIKSCRDRVYQIVFDPNIIELNATCQ